MSTVVFALQAAAGDDEVRLDEEMDRVVWNEGGAAPACPSPGAAPRRDRAAPPPYDDRECLSVRVPCVVLARGGLAVPSTTHTVAHLPTYLL